MRGAMEVGVSWKEGHNNIGISTATNGGKIIHYGISYCPFCGKQLIVNELELIKE